MKVLLYGRLAEAIGPNVELAVGAGCSVGEVRSRLAVGHPAAADALRRSRVFLGQSFVRDEQLVSEVDQIEFLPPVSGG